MWFGRIIPLFRFPLLEETSVVGHEGEERTLPLPRELCVGMNIEPGTALYVTFGINPNEQLDKINPSVDPGRPVWGDDLAGWMVIAPFPLSIFKSGKLMRLDVHLNNKPGAFQRGVTEKVKAAGGIFLCMEVLSTGDMGSLILLPPDVSAAALRKSFDPKDDEEDKDKDVLGVETRHWGDPKDQLQLGWISSLFPPLGSDQASRPTPIAWKPDRRVLVRDGQITVPFGEFWYHYNFGRREKYRAEGKIPPKLYNSNYCLLARDMELPVLLALFPARPLFKVELDVSAETSLSAGQDDSNRQVGSGMLHEAVRELSAQDSNIWHVQNTFRSLIFESDEKGDGSKGPDPKSDSIPDRVRGIESRISIVASVPEQYQHDRPEVIRSYLNGLQKRLLALRRPASQSPQDQRLDEAFNKLPKDIENSIEKGLTKGLEEVLKKLEGGGLTLEKEARKELLNQLKEQGALGTSSRRLLRKIIDEQMTTLAKSLDLPFVKNVDIHGPPLFRCFFSHSASPGYEERDHIDRLKMLLESEVFEVIEGEFSLGMSTEELSRGKIRRCNLFISFLWPRDDFRTEKGEYLPPEWVIHEESFAIGQSIPVYRVREQGVMGPRYERDRVEFLFKKGEIDSWKSLEHKFRVEVRQLIQQILLGMHPTTQGR